MVHICPSRSRLIAFRILSYIEDASLEVSESHRQPLPTVALPAEERAVTLTGNTELRAIFSSLRQRSRYVASGVAASLTHIDSLAIFETAPARASCAAERIWFLLPRWRYACCRQYLSFTSARASLALSWPALYGDRRPNRPLQIRLTALLRVISGQRVGESLVRCGFQ